MKGNNSPQFVGIDLFAGAGGLSLGAIIAGIKVELAIENNPHAASTYAYNHPKTKTIIDDISNISHIDVSKKGNISILFGGPPCQG
ncbi:MAG: DNA cytosine methyltransferase, partial [Anaerolineales bacterium]